MRIEKIMNVQTNIKELQRTVENKLDEYIKLALALGIISIIGIVIGIILDYRVLAISLILGAISLLIISKSFILSIIAVLGVVLLLTNNLILSLKIATIVCLVELIMYGLIDVLDIAITYKGLRYFGETRGDLDLLRRAELTEEVMKYKLRVVPLKISVEIIMIAIII